MGPFDGITIVWIGQVFGKRRFVSDDDKFSTSRSDLLCGSPHVVRVVIVCTIIIIGVATEFASLIFDQSKGPCLRAPHCNPRRANNSIAPDLKAPS
jgi:hypothetical protein